MTKKYVRKAEKWIGRDTPVPRDWVKLLPEDVDARLVLEVVEDDGIGKWYWHIHHEILAEPLTEPLENRINFIKNNKNASEVATRLKWLTPVQGPLPEGYEAIWKRYFPTGVPARGQIEYYILSPELEKLHKKEHEYCPWNGKTLL